MPMIDLTFDQRSPTDRGRAMSASASNTMDESTTNPFTLPSLATVAHRRRRSRRTLRIDGKFLIVAGTVQLVSELLSHYRSTGLHGDTFADSAYTIGFVEAHGLAAMIGVALLWAARQPDRRSFHWFAIAAHIFLGAANLIFWNSFVEFDFVAPGVLATVAHVVFIAAQARCLMTPIDRAPQDYRQSDGSPHAH
ncbi:MAG TPA: hypothetical protein VIT64_14090 [Ilumatobacteraceae bacterium]